MKTKVKQATAAPAPDRRHWQVARTLDNKGFMLIYAEEHSVISIGFHTEEEFRAALENVIGQYKVIKARESQKPLSDDGQKEGQKKGKS